MQQKIEAGEHPEEQQDGHQSEEKGSPLSKVLGKIIAFIIPRQKASLKESLEEILDEQEENKTPNQADETSIIRNVLEFNELYVEDVMIPRADIFAIESSVSFEDLKKNLLEKIYTRIPVYKEDLDEVKGFIHIKDVAKLVFRGEKFNIDNITRKCLFVPASMKISNLLIRMQQNRVHIAIVVDEYGGTEGLITLEDIMEEIVGKIEDEHDMEDTLEPILRKIKEGEYAVSSRITIDEFTKKTGISLNTETEKEYDTIGGLIFDISGRIPVAGEIIKISPAIEVEVKEADARSIKKLIVRKK